MTPTKTIPEMRIELDKLLGQMVKNFQIDGFSPGVIKEEMLAAVYRATDETDVQGSDRGRAEGEDAREAETKKTLDNYGKKVGS